MARMATAFPGVGWGTLIVTFNFGTAADDEFGDLPLTLFGVAFDDTCLGLLVGVLRFGDLVGVFCLGDFVGVFCLGDFVGVLFGDFVGVFDVGDLVGVFFGDFEGVFCLGDFEGVFCLGETAADWFSISSSRVTLGDFALGDFPGVLFGDLDALVTDGESLANFTLRSGFGLSPKEVLEEDNAGVLPFRSGVVGGRFLSNSSGLILGPNDTRDLLADDTCAGVDFLFCPRLPEDAEKQRKKILLYMDNHSHKCKQTVISSKTTTTYTNDQPPHRLLC